MLWFIFDAMDKNLLDLYKASIRTYLIEEDWLSEVRWICKNTEKKTLNFINANGPKFPYSKSIYHVGTLTIIPPYRPLK